MLRISILCVGKIKEKYWTDAIAEYTKRLSRYCKLDIKEVQDEKTPDHAGKVIEESIKTKEGERLLKLISPDDYVITLEIQGEMLDSMELSRKLEKLTLEGTSHIDLVIGGSIGLSMEIRKRSDYRLSFSKMTFPHQLMRVILLEQIYRSFRISSGEPYHK